MIPGVPISNGGPSPPFFNGDPRWAPFGKWSHDGLWQNLVALHYFVACRWIIWIEHESFLSGIYLPVESELRIPQLLSLWMVNILLTSNLHHWVGWTISLKLQPIYLLVPSPPQFTPNQSCFPIHSILSNTLNTSPPRPVRNARDLISIIPPGHHTCIFRSILPSQQKLAMLSIWCTTN